MTYLELAKKCDAASLVKLLDNTHYGCRQAMGKTIALVVFEDGENDKRIIGNNIRYAQCS